MAVLNFAPLITRLTAVEIKREAGSLGVQDLPRMGEKGTDSEVLAVGKVPGNGATHGAVFIRTMPKPAGEKPTDAAAG